ncbi:MAG: serine/threonine protein kinase [Deltaproteobacteria bacterium]|nr:MAG: serine/threonine protein kinase [Deltaproteobacteria bacterium]
MRETMASLGRERAPGTRWWRARGLGRRAAPSHGGDDPTHQQAVVSGVCAAPLSSGCQDSSSRTPGPTPRGRVPPMATHYCSRCLTTFQGTPDRCPNLSCGKGPPKEGWGSVLGEGDLLDRHYLIEKVLAIGGAGLTYLAREVDDAGGPVGPRLAIKVLYTQRDAGPFLRRLSNEAQILQDLDHAHIVKCRGFVHRTGQAPYLVTLFEEGGALTDFVESAGGLSPRVAAGVLKQILLALDMAHQRGVVHRDLKPDNVLLHQHVPETEIPLVRVADFGIAKVFGGVGDRLTRLGSFIGTPEYAAPEQFEGVTPTPATDVFAAGGVLYYLITGEPPLKFSHRHDIAASHDELLQQLPPQLPTTGQDSMTLGALQEVINWTMTLRPGDRWTVQQILVRLNDVLEGRPEGQPLFTDQGAPPRRVAPTTTFIPQRTDEVPKHHTLDGPDGRTLSGPTAETRSDHGEPRSSQDTWRLDLDEAPPVPSKPMAKGASPPPPPPTPPPAPPVSASEPPPPPSPTPPPAPVTPPPAPPEPPPAPKASPAPAPKAATPRPAPANAFEPEPPASGGGGKGLLAAGGAVFVLGGGALLVVVGLIVVWQLGLLGGGGAAGPVDLSDAAHSAEKKAISESLDRAGADIGKLCGVKGDAKVALTIAASGGITDAAVDPSSVESSKLDCVSKALAKVTVPRTSGGEAKLRTRVKLD